jgi:FMN phosphatase YigB (HAD superfamily)
MNPRPIVLLDVDGVLLDNSLYDLEWQRLADDACIPRLGGRPGQWAPALHAAWLDAARALLGPHGAQRLAPDLFWRALEHEWIERACALAGVVPPASAAERTLAARAASAHYFGHTRALVPDAAATIAELAQRCELHMSSGNPAFVVELVLQRMAVRPLVGQPFGSDLLGVYKQDAASFYRTLLTRIDADPRQVWVVDDMDGPLAAAHALGARTIKIGTTTSTATHARVTDTFARVPELIAAG